MILIAHRANLTGPDYSTANTPHQINKVMELGLNCEADVWKVNDDFFLGHDEPKYKTELEFLKNEKLWCHAKNLEALESMLDNDIHCFWHESDRFTLTSKGYVWTFPGEESGRRSVIVHKEADWENKYDCHAVCSDYPIT
jgi:hypothetical protein